MASAVIRSALDPKMCAYPLVVGETFLLYADRMGEGDTLLASACTRSERASLAGEEIRRLDRSHPRSGTIPKQLAAPARCPVHQDIPLRTTGTSLAGFLPETAESEYRRIRANRFPYAALQFKHPPLEWEWSGTFATDEPAITCALCRTEALAWCRDHGAECPRFPDPGMGTWYPSWLYDWSDARLPEREHPPSALSGFYYDDGNRLRFDSLTGNLTRYVEGYGDTTIHVNLGKDQQARLFEEIVESGFFKLGPALDEDFDSGPPGPCGHVEFCAASDSLQRCDWWYRSYNVSSPVRAKFNRLLSEIHSMLEASPEYRALPPLPKGL